MASELTAEKMERLKAISRKHSIKVLRATRSPMNAQRWSLDLECGHEVWVTASQKPQFAACLTCNPPKHVEALNGK